MQSLNEPTIKGLAFQVHDRRHSKQLERFQVGRRDVHSTPELPCGSVPMTDRHQVHPHVQSNSLAVNMRRISRSTCADILQSHCQQNQRGAQPRQEVAQNLAPPLFPQLVVFPHVGIAAHKCGI